MAVVSVCVRVCGGGGEEDDYVGAKHLLLRHCRWKGGHQRLKQPKRCTHTHTYARTQRGGMLQLSTAVTRDTCYCTRQLPFAGERMKNERRRGPLSRLGSPYVSTCQAAAKSLSLFLSLASSSSSSSSFSFLLLGELLTIAFQQLKQHQKQQQQQQQQQQQKQQQQRLR